MKANSSETAEQIMERVPQVDILKHYFKIYSLPALINSPLRRDKNPSFYLYTPDGEEVRFIDYATGDKGDIILLMQNYFRLSFSGVIRKIGSEKPSFLLSQELVSIGINPEQRREFVLYLQN